MSSCLYPAKFQTTVFANLTTEATVRTNPDGLLGPWGLQSRNSFEAAKPHGFLGCERAQPAGCEVAVFEDVAMPNLDRLADRDTATMGATDPTHRNNARNRNLMAYLFT